MRNFGLECFAFYYFKKKCISLLLWYEVLITYTRALTCLKYWRFRGHAHSSQTQEPIGTEILVFWSRALVPPCSSPASFTQISVDNPGFWLQNKQTNWSRGSKVSQNVQHPNRKYQLFVFFSKKDAPWGCGRLQTHAMHITDASSVSALISLIFLFF